MFQLSGARRGENYRIAMNVDCFESFVFLVGSKNAIDA